MRYLSMIFLLQGFRQKLLGPLFPKEIILHKSLELLKRALAETWRMSIDWANQVHSISKDLPWKYYRIQKHIFELKGALAIIYEGFGVELIIYLSFLGKINKMQIII